MKTDFDVNFRQPNWFFDMNFTLQYQHNTRTVSGQAGFDARENLNADTDNQNIIQLIVFSLPFFNFNFQLIFLIFHTIILDAQ